MTRSCPGLLPEDKDARIWASFGWALFQASSSTEGRSEDMAEPVQEWISRKPANAIMAPVLGTRLMPRDSVIIESSNARDQDKSQFLHTFYRIDC